MSSLTYISSEICLQMSHSNFEYGAKQFRRVLKAMSIWGKWVYHSFPTDQAQTFKNKWVLNYKCSSVPMLFLDTYGLAKSVYVWSDAAIYKYSKKVIRLLSKLKI